MYTPDRNRKIGVLEVLPVPNNETPDSPEAAITSSVRDRVSISAPDAYIVTDHSLISAAYPDSVPICTDSFMEVSKENYPLPWLVREIVQNFVDGNIANPASLDGVDFNHNVEGGSHKFTITGAWPFEDPSGLIALHSGKSKSETNKAGGNGIGLKQTVLRFLRDYGVDEFTVIGEGWKVSYRMVDKQCSNDKLGESPHNIENDWLLAKVERSDNYGQCIYEISTTNSEVASALDDFGNLGVSADNEHLTNPDYQNEHGVFKWIPFHETSPLHKVKENMPKGRLFINGQVMNYSKKGSTPETYWDGPELVSIQLNDLNYDMSIDRPPVDFYKLSSYVSEMVSKMNIEELIDQLKKSEYVWGQLCRPAGYWQEPAALVLIEKFVNALMRTGGFGNNRYNWEKFKSDFGENYLYLDKTLSKKETSELVKKGYVLCPDFFKQLGIPPASSKLNALEQAKKERPKNPDMRWMAGTGGIQVGFAVPDLKNVDQFFPAFVERFSEMIEGMEVLDCEEGQIVIDMPMDFDESLFYQQMITLPKNEYAVDLYDLRGFIYYAIKNEIFDDVIISNGNVFITFAIITNNGTGEEKFVTKVSDGAIRPGLHAEIRHNYWEPCLDAFNLKATHKKPKRKPKRRPKRKKSGTFTSNYYFGKLVKTLGVTFGALGVWWCINNADYLAYQANQLASSSSNDTSMTGNANPVNTGRRSSEKSLDELMADYDNSRVKGSSQEPPPQIYQAPQQKDDVNNRERIENPSQSQIKQLEVFRDYLYMTTGINVENELFIYEGDGAYGVNVGRNSIGLHVSLLEVEFDEALSTFLHETAHNKYSDHGVEFRHLNSILHTATHDCIAGIAQKLDRGGELSLKESAIVKTEAMWDYLRGL